MQPRHPGTSTRQGIDGGNAPPMLLPGSHPRAVSRAVLYDHDYNAGIHARAGNLPVSRRARLATVNQSFRIVSNTSFTHSLCASLIEHK